MPWKEPGKGNKDPWNSGNQQPPDLDDVFNSIKSRVQSIFGGGSGKKSSGSGAGMGSGGGIFPLVILLLVFWIGWDAVHIIDEAEQGVVQRFGKYSRTLPPGINVTLPGPIEHVTKVNVSSVRSIQDRGQMLSQDENIVELNYSVQYRVNDPKMFLFNVRDPEVTVKEAAESALRDAVGNNGLDFILSGPGREIVGVNTETMLQEIMDIYESGIQITKFNLESSTAPAQVLTAFEDVNKAREDRQRFIEEAEVHVNSVIPEARGAAARIIQESEGYRASTIALAEGEADRFTYLLKEYQQAPAITRKRLYLQSMETVLSRTKKVLLDVDSSSNIMYLPLDQLGAGESANRIPPPVLGTDSTGTSSGDRGAPGRTAERETRR